MVRVHAPCVEQHWLPMPAGADELANATLGSFAFVMRTPTDVTGAAGGIFDDLVAYMTAQDLLQPLLIEKTLKGVCLAYCAAPASSCLATAIPVGNPSATCP